VSIKKVATAEDTSEQLIASQLKARQAWHRLWMRIQSITPRGLARFLLVVGALVVILWLFVSTLPSLITLVIGITLAYITLPVVNWLDHFLPHSLAVLLVILAELGLVVAFFALLIPALVTQATLLLGALPSTDQLHAYFQQLLQQAQSWPEPIRAFLRGGLQQAATNTRQNFISYVQGLFSLGFKSILGVIGTFTFGLSLLVIPTWIFSILKDQHRARTALNRVLPDWLRPDFWAVVRIVDGIFSVYLREVVVLCVAVGLATYGGLRLLEYVGVQGIPFPALLAIIAGFTDFIPTVGPILGAVVGVSFGLISSWQTALAILVLYIGIRFLRRWLLSPLFAGSVDIHPAILVVILVVASQFGLVWLFIAAPLAMVVRDLFRYTYGRLSEPPRPAGVLPGQSVSTTREPQANARRSMVPFPVQPINQVKKAPRPSEEAS
jgi:predicted PurR-regulated permease PerM